MNESKVRNLIQNEIAALHARIGGKAARKQYPVGKAQTAKLQELGILHLMPAGFGHSDADAVISAATRKENGGWTSWGEGEEIPASDLNKALSEKVERTAIVPDYEYEWTEEDLAELDAYVALENAAAQADNDRFLAELARQDPG